MKGRILLNILMALLTGVILCGYAYWIFFIYNPLGS